MKVLIYNTDEELKLLTNRVIKAKQHKYRLVASREYKDSKRKRTGTYR